MKIEIVKNLSKLSVLVGFFLINEMPICYSSVDEPFPPKPPLNENSTKRLQYSVAPTIFFKKVEFELEKTTLNEIIKSAGVGEIEHHGDAGDSEYWICYINSHKEPLRMWISSGETGGDDHVMQSFYAEIIDHSHINDHPCKILPKDLQPISLSNQIWLGQTQDELVKKMGEPVSKSHDWWLYKYSGSASIKGYDEISIFSARISDGKIVALFASKTVTN